MQRCALCLLLCCLLFAPTTSAVEPEKPSIDMSNKQAVIAYIQHVNPKLKIKTIHQLLDAIERNRKMYGLPEDLQLGLINTESMFHQYAKGTSGDSGFWQIVPRFHTEMIKALLKKKIIKNKNYYDVNTNSMIGGAVLYECMKMNKWNTKKALLCYNGSTWDEEAVYAKAVMKRVNRIVSAQKVVY